ncbi:hypothetical protein GGF46_002643 [Coemansia sp. RSA 552]|nr:hypothetical protein GGF46_002643 [Coemansia sp. RSA 552]
MHRPSRAAALLLLAPLVATIALGLIARGAPASVAAAAPWWASKRSLLNVRFAKVAWGWTTALFAVALPVRARSPQAAGAAVLRYALATLYWVVLARWFFGPPLLDRLFVATGGACDVGPALADTLSPIASLQQCRAAGGRWAGGHDVSGHCFLLIHSALFLAEEVLAPLWAGRVRAAEAHASRARAAARWAVLAAATALAGLWVFMLYTTARYFHGGPELVSGTLAGVAYWGALYHTNTL